MSELKPCPFCGGEVELSFYQYYAWGREFKMLQCKKCRIRVENDDATDDVVQLWNRRVKDD